MRQMQAADLTASANEIDNRMGPIPGRSSDRIANELRWAATAIEQILQEREAIARAIFGEGWKCCINLPPYVQGVVNELAEARDLIATFDQDTVDHQRDLIEQTREKPPSFTPPAHPTSDTKAALKSAIDHIEHMATWITSKSAGYRFEALGEDMPRIRAAFEALGGKQ